jgi:uncharacterized membrane protein
MSTTKHPLHPAVAEYVARTQAVLADLPEAEVEEIGEDIGQHVGEVAAELGEGVSVEALADRLGTPEQYASELRAAAGYPPAALPRGRRWVARIALWSLILGTAAAFLAGLASTPRMSASPAGSIVIFGPFLVLALILIFARATTVEAVASLPESRVFTLAGFLAPLRPGWWALRVLLLSIAVLLALRVNIDDGYGFLPLLMLIVLLWFGRRARTDRRWGWIVNPANAFTIGLGIALLGWLLTAPPH